MEKFKDFEKNLKTFNGYMGEPKLRYFDNGGCVCDFSIPLKNKKDDTPVWLNCKTYNQLAEKIGEYAKGTNITVQGYFKIETGKDNKEYTNFIVLFGE